MGASASMQPEAFSLAKEEYEAKKGEGLSDEELFNHMKSYIENLMVESAKVQEEQAHAAESATAPAEAPPAEAPAAATEEAPPAEVPAEAEAPSA